jgi:hypothetical protein
VGSGSSATIARIFSGYGCPAAGQNCLAPFDRVRQRSLRVFLRPNNREQASRKWRGLHCCGALSSRLAEEFADLRPGNDRMILSKASAT